MTFLTNPSEDTQIVDIKQKIMDELGEVTTSSSWSAWSKTFTNSGGIITKMDSWEDFKSMYNFAKTSILLDESNHVIWFKGSLTQAVYYKYR
ncbi:MAG: hypothetical protein IAX22_02550 [Candidatus Bathyarchaeota archaeon]|nr:hypothetical protein [Candidatus Bathyarchaeota archaeon]